MPLSVRPSPSTALRPPALVASSLLFGLCLGLGSLSASAEKGDRNKPMTLESDKPCTVSLAKQTSVCSGNVVISQGTLLLRADKLELRETPEGYQVAVVTGTSTKPAQYRQKRDGVDEVVEGLAQRIDYDSRSGTLRFNGQAVVRRLRDGAVADEIHGGLIVWDSQAELFSVQGGSPTEANPGGRVRAVISPRPQPAESSASAPAAAPAPRPPTLTGSRP